MALLFLAWILLAKSDEKSHLYEQEEDVIMWFNKVLPFNNPQESYAFNKLPLCTGKYRSELFYSLTIGEAIEGHELIDSRMGIQFLRDVSQGMFCETKLTKDEMQMLKFAVQNNYWMQMVIDDLPVWGPLGKIDSNTGEPFIFTRYNFYIYYNSNQIIKVDYIGEQPVSLDYKRNNVLSFKYSIKWMETETQFANRFEYYLDPGFYETNIHWLSIFNSFVMVILMCIVVVLILIQSIRRDYANYKRQEDEIAINDLGLTDTQGWKQVAGDAFRPPSNLLAFTVLYSNGIQLTFVSLTMIIIAIAHPLYQDRGYFTTLLFYVYSSFGIVGGVACGSYYAQGKGKRWMLAMFSSCWFLPVSFAFIGGIQNSIAIAYSSSAAIPFFSILKVAGLILFIHTPLFVLGNIYGRNNWHTATIPIKINPISQPIIRQKKWYNQPRNLIILGGVLPFVSISVEVYYIFTSFWNYKFYYVYGFGLLAAILLALTVICISIVSTYFILNSEDYRWPWVSFLSSASLGGYIFSYSIYYYFFRTHMTGLLQLAFYFGYTFFISVYLSLVAGAIGYTSAYYFVKILYSNVKPD